MPYRTNTAPPILDKWDGRLAPNQANVGPKSDLRFATDGRVVNIRTGEYVKTYPMRDAIRGAK